MFPRMCAVPPYAANPAITKDVDPCAGREDGGRGASGTTSDWPTTLESCLEADRITYFLR